MKNVRYEEDGVATAVGAIFAILIFIFLLSLFITSYVPAEMKTYEEQYASGITNDMMQFTSALSMLSLNYNQGESVSVNFDLQSGYIPLFTTPTVGEMSLSSATQGENGYITVENSTMNVGAGGVLTIASNDRYFVDQSLTYEFSTIFYEQVHTNPLINSSLQSDLIQVGPPVNGTINLSINLFNLMGGPLNLSSLSSFGLSITAISRSSTIMVGNFTLTYSSALGEQLYNTLKEELATITDVSTGYTAEGGGLSQVSVNTDSIPILVTVSVVSVMLSVNG
ncbi:MAG: hypothetical protein M1163_03675 [Candidatus Thermoplasmatota archaeon]|jgi:hypothetical protein|nr:hypothetical protein [Candidatus Thermoplasmatota archaeon]